MYEYVGPNSIQILIKTMKETDVCLKKCCSGVNINYRLTILRKPKASQFFFGMKLCPNSSVKKSYKKKHDYGFSGDSLFSVSNLNPNYVSDDESSFEDQGFSYNFALGKIQISLF